MSAVTAVSDVSESRQRTAAAATTARVTAIDAFRGLVMFLMLAEAMRLVSPFGRLSRGVAGVVGGVIVCNTPGSPTGCVEQLGAVLDVLPHALRLLHDEPTSH